MGTGPDFGFSFETTDLGSVIWRSSGESVARKLVLDTASMPSTTKLRKHVHLNLAAVAIACPHARLALEFHGDGRLHDRRFSVNSIRLKFPPAQRIHRRARQDVRT